MTQKHTMMSGAAWHELVNRFLDRQAVERGLSAHTIEAYALDLRDFVDFCEERENRTRRLRCDAR